MESKSSGKETIRITVKSMTRDERFVVSHEATVADIKPMIAERFDADANQLCLIYAGRKLNDQGTLSAQNVRDGFAIHLVIRPTNRDMTFTPPAEARINQTNWEPLSDISANLISNPDYLRNLIESDPRLRAYVDQHADIQFAINNPDVLRHYIEVISDPQMLQEFLRERGVEAQHTSNATDGLSVLHVMYDNLLRAQSARTAADQNAPPATAGTNQDTQSSNDQLTEAQMLSELLNSPQMQQFFQQLITDPSFLQSLLNNNAALEDPRMMEYVHTNFGEILRNLETQAGGGNQSQANGNEATPEARYTNQLEQLNLMGFTNRDANLQALVISSGDINLAIDALTRNL